jgi:DNA-binding IclR family transcriptional regulator
MAGAVNKAFRIIRLLRRSPVALSVVEIARDMRVAPSTAHAVLVELAAQGVVLQDQSRRYRLGPALFYFGSAYARNAAIYRGVWNELVELARDIGLTAVIAIPWEDHHLILNVHRDGPPGIEVAVGGRVPLDAGAWGKAYYAWSGTTPPRGPVGRIEEHVYRDQVATTLERGYAVDGGDFVAGAGSVASAITSEFGYEGVATLVGTVSRLSELGFEQIGERLAAVASRASYALGDHTRIKLLGVDESGGHRRVSTSREHPLRTRAAANS